MTDTQTRTEWHTTADGPESELAELRRRLAVAELRAVDAETRAINAVAAEEVAQFAFETAKLRADRFEAAFKEGLLEKITPILPEKLENSAEALADCLVDEIAVGTLYDDLVIDGHIQSWLEER